MALAASFESVLFPRPFLISLLCNFERTRLSILHCMPFKARIEVSYLSYSKKLETEALSDHGVISLALASTQIYLTWVKGANLMRDARCVSCHIEHAVVQIGWLKMETRLVSLHELYTKRGSSMAEAG